MTDFINKEKLDFLDYKTPFILIKEIYLKDLYEKDDREKFVIYSLNC